MNTSTPVHTPPHHPGHVAAGHDAAAATLPQVTLSPGISQPRRDSHARRMLTWGIVGLLLLGAAGFATDAIQLGRPDDGSAPAAGEERDSSWSYFHDTSYDTSGTGPKWDTDRTRSTDPDEAVLGDTSRWEYDGPYRYGPYGSDGMRRRAAGRETVDPLYAQSAPLPDVFTARGDLDPSGGRPVGGAPSSMTNPYFDPYAGYSNPYSNRIRMAWGEGYGRGMSLTP